MIECEVVESGRTISVTRRRGRERKKKESEKQSIELNGQSSNINGFTEMSSSMIGCCIDRQTDSHY
jgi:hypothetical protein